MVRNAEVLIHERFRMGHAILRGANAVTTKTLCLDSLRTASVSRLLSLHIAEPKDIGCAERGSSGA